MEERKNTYSISERNYYWGEFYTTLKEMKENGDAIEEEFPKKLFTLIDSLENAQSLEEVKTIIKGADLSETQVNYINSRCLDGIVGTIDKTDPMIELIKRFPNHIETFKFYTQFVFIIKGKDYNRLSVAYITEMCKNGCAEILKIAIQNGHSPHEVFPLYFANTIPTPVWETIYGWLAYFGQVEALKEIMIYTITDLFKEKEIPQTFLQCFEWVCYYPHRKYLDMIEVFYVEERKNESIKVLLEILNSQQQFRFYLQSCFYTVCSYCSVEIVEYMINTYNINIHAHNDRAVYRASRDDNMEVAKFLLSKGASQEAYMRGIAEE